MIVDFTCTVW